MAPRPRLALSDSGQARRFAGQGVSRETIVYSTENL
jgi:hypothetical protein